MKGFNNSKASFRTLTNVLLKCLLLCTVSLLSYAVNEVPEEEFVSKYQWGSIQEAVKIKKQSYIKEFPIVFSKVSQKEYQKINSPTKYNNITNGGKIEHLKNIFSAPVEIELSTLNAPVYFLLNEFKEDVNINNSVFNGDAVFTWNHFHKNANFANAQFNKGTNFFSNIFNNYTVFYRSRFKSLVDFNASIFNDGVNFENSYFFTLANLHDIRFLGKASFKNTVFAGVANFSNSYFQEETNFDNVRFSSHADFSNAVFKNTVTFKNTILPRHLNLSHVSLSKPLNFTSAIHPQGTKCRINLMGTDISKIDLSYHDFKLDFPANANYYDIAHVYERLLKNFENKGLFIHYKDLSIEFMQYKYKHNNSWFINLAQKYWWNYGFDKQMIFYWILGIITFLTLMNALFYSKLTHRTYLLPSLKTIHESSIINRSRVLTYFYNLPQAFIHTMILFFGVLIGFKYKPHSFKDNNILVNIYIMSIMITGLFCIIFVLSYLLGIKT